MTSSAWGVVRAFALYLPSAVEDFPWGQSVIKVDYPKRRDPAGLAVGPMFLWLGRRDVPEPAVSVKLKASYDEAVTMGSARPMSYSGLGRWGWLTIPLAGTDLHLVQDWVDESYRLVAPKKLIAKINER